MSLRALPLMVIALIAYNVLIVFTNDAAGTLRQIVIALPLMTGRLELSWGDLLVLMTLIVLFIELMKSTYTSSATMIDHALSMIVFIVCLVELLTVRQAATSVFFFITVASAIDVIAGYSIGIRVARRDLNIGADN
jgi:hypothetical protein